MSLLNKKSKMKPQYAVETITPGEARQILEGNENNRRLNMATVDYYRRQIENGVWQINGESIKLDDRGYLLDGQHRLLAIVKANKPVTTLVVRGLSSEAFKTIDAGKSRSMSDYLKIDGCKANTNVLAAAARIVMAFDKKTGIYKASTKKVSPHELLSFVDNHTGLAESVRFSEKLKKITSMSVASACHYAFSLVDPEKAQDFFEAIATGAGLTSGNPALTVRNRLMTVRADKRAGSAYQRMIIAYLVQAFNFYRAGEKLSNSVYHQESDIVLKDWAGSVR